MIDLRGGANPHNLRFKAFDAQTVRINCGSVFRPADERHFMGGGELRAVEAADGAGTEHDNLHGPQLIMPRCKRETVLVRDGDSGSAGRVFAIA